MGSVLSEANLPQDLRSMSFRELEQLAAEIREELCAVVRLRSAHFASNLGVVELCLALHRVFDFSYHRLIWDTGHQIYPHKMVTGRHAQIHTIRSKGGLMGYPNPAESIYDLFLTGHAGCSISCLLGLKTGDDMLGHRRRRAVAVIGDGAFASGIVFEALSSAGELGKDLLGILNDNKMSISPRVGALARYLDRARMMPIYSGFKRELHRLLSHMPLGDRVERAFMHAKDGVKASLHGGMLFEELGWRYFGPVDGHNLRMLVSYLEELKEAEGPLLLHVLTEKGHGFEPARKDPVWFHTPAPFECQNGKVVPIRKQEPYTYTDVAAKKIHQLLAADRKRVVITAAMCEGNKLGRVRDELPEQFFDTGICEAHAVAFAAGLAKSGIQPIVANYSTFLQRSYDQLFQEVALQNLPVVLCMDRAGLVGPDGPTHHGLFDVAYIRHLPNFVVAAPGDELDLELMLEFALAHGGPIALRYPKAAADRVERRPTPVELGQAEVLDWGHDAMIIAYGSTLAAAAAALRRLQSDGLDVGLINARFAKPLDTATLLRAVEQCGFVLTVEEGALAGGFGSALLEAANDAGLDCRHVRRLGVPDRFIEHAERAELLEELELDEAGIYRNALLQAERVGLKPSATKRRQVG